MACVTARKEDEKKRESHKQAMHKVPDLPYVNILHYTVTIADISPC